MITISNENKMSTVDLELNGDNNDDDDDHVNETKNLYKNSLSMIINETKESNLKSSIMTNNNNIDNQTTTTKSLSSFVIEQQIKHSANHHYNHYNNHHLSMDVKVMLLFFCSNSILNVMKKIPFGNSFPKKLFCLFVLYDANLFYLFLYFMFYL